MDSTSLIRKMQHERIADKKRIAVLERALELACIKAKGDCFNCSWYFEFGNSCNRCSIKKTDFVNQARAELAKKTDQTQRINDWNEKVERV